MKTLLITTPLLSGTLSKSWLGAIRLYVQIVYFLITRKLLKVSKDFKLKVVYNENIFFFHLRYPMDVAVLREVFLDKEYALVPEGDIRTIVDLGAHFGDTALYYHARFPNARIIAVEASPESAERLRKHVREIPQIEVVEAAIGAKDGVVEFSVMPSSLGSSTVDRGGELQKIVVPQITLETLFKNLDIKNADLIKVDIEGGEFSLFDSLISPEKYARAYIGEVHFDLCPDCDRSDFWKTFHQFRLTKKIVKNGSRALFFAHK